MKKEARNTYAFDGEQKIIDISSVIRSEKLNKETYRCKTNYKIVF